MDSAIHWALVGMGMMFLIAVGSFIGLIAYACHLSGQLDRWRRWHKRHHRPEVPRDSDRRPMRERL